MLKNKNFKFIKKIRGIIMVMGGREMYKISCPKCGWHKDITIMKRRFSLANLLVLIPICPKCGSKTTKFKMPIKF